MQDTTVQRVVARADFSMQLCIKLVEDMKKEMDTLNKAKFVTGNTQGVIQTRFQPWRPLRRRQGREGPDEGEEQPVTAGGRKAGKEPELRAPYLHSSGACKYD